MRYNSKAENCADFFYHAFCNILIIGLPLVIISAIVLSSLHSSAAELSSADNLSISIPTACTLVSEVNDAHSTQVLNGTYVPDIGKTTITTYCNDENGYVIYAAGYSNDELGNNKLISSRSTSTTNFDIPSNTNSSGNVSGWAMKLTTTNVGNLGGEPGNEEYGYITNNNGNIVQTNQDADTPTIEPTYNNMYGIVPSQWAKVVTKPSNTVASTTGSSFSTTYAVYASTTQPAGIYNGQVRYLLAHPSVSPSIQYMQDVANWKDELGVNETALVLDRRDYKAYWVTKLEDGHIWMTQNLAIDLSYTDALGNTVMRTFTSEDTDLNVIYNPDTDPNSYQEYGGDGYSYDSVNDIISWTPASSAQVRNINDDNTISGWVNSDTEPYSAKKPSGPNNGHESLGDYYNWTASIASNDSSSLQGYTIGNPANNPKNSICPKGWRLPTTSLQDGNIINSTNEFARLNNLYNSGKTSGENADSGLLVAPLWFIRGGHIITKQLANYDTYGYYWPSTYNGAQNAPGLGFSGDAVWPNSRSYEVGARIYGQSVRCVAK